MKKISVLGSTGSIGTQTLDIVRQNSDLEIVALSADKNIDMLFEQIKEFNPLVAGVYNTEKAEELKVRLDGLKKNSPVRTEIVSGMDGLIACATVDEADIVLTAVVGMVGIQPTIAAIRAHKDIALANKETLVSAGHIIMPLVKKHGVKLLPVDSEHSAIFQSLQGQDSRHIRKILLTASGGPFRGKKREELLNIRPEDALKHPNWTMGRKITIDSASMVNKGLEVIEARWLFDVRPDDIQVVIQPQSVIHSMVEYEDGAVIAQLGVPDMKVPIQYALCYPERRPIGGESLDFFKLAKLDFYEPDYETFVGLKMAIEAIKEGGSLPTVFNAANEYAVAAFLDKKIGFLDIYEYINKALEAHKKISEPDVEQILEIEQETYRFLSTL